MRSGIAVPCLFLFVATMASADVQSGSVGGTTDDDVRAKDALCSFFEYLSTGHYEDAASLYGGSYWFLHDHFPEVDPTDYPALWANTCKRGGLQCLEIREIVGSSALSNGDYRFAVKFSKANGQLFIRGPCCGADPAESPPDSIFNMDLQEVEEQFLVVSYPPYVP